jgi:phosphate transport system substrate-binding protein
MCERKKKMTKKSIIISVISVICLVGIVSFAMYGCSSKGSNEKKEKTGVSGQITVISREEGSGTRDAFVELMGVTDENGNDITADSAELTNSTSVVMSTVKGNKNAIGYVSLGSLSSDVKAVGLDGVAPSTATVKDGSYKLQRPFKIAYIDTKLTDIDKDFISFITSKQGEAIISKEGYISAEATQDYTKSGKKGTITIAGSTSVAPVMNVLADEYKKLNPDVKIEIQESGSSAGIESAIQGAVEIAMSSRELKDDEAKTLKSQTIALDGIAVIVNSSNSLDTLTSKQVKNIFEGNVSTWEEVIK